MFRNSCGNILAGYLPWGLTPTACLLLATFDDQPAGCVALKPVDKNTRELKRSYVKSEFWGHKIGEQVVNAFVAEARICGYHRAVLDSHISMKAAHKSVVFKFVDRPLDFSGEVRPHIVFMECEL